MGNNYLDIFNIPLHDWADYEDYYDFVNSVTGANADDKKQNNNNNHEHEWVNASLFHIKYACKICGKLKEEDDEEIQNNT